MCRILLSLCWKEWFAAVWCAMHRPAGVTERELWSRLQQQPAWHRLTQSEAEVEVAVAIPDRAQTQELFGIPLWDRDIPPVGLRIRNGD
jgi:hypothetical protein